MTIDELHKELKSGIVRPLYLFTGEEFGVMDIYIAQLKTVAGEAYIGADSVAEVIPKFTNSGFLQLPQYFIVRDDPEFIKSGNVESLNNLVSQSGGSLILIFNSVKKTTKFWKSNIDKFVVFEKLTTQQLMSTVLKKVDDERAASRLINVCENNLSRINIELNKVQHFAQINNLDTANTVIHLIDNGVIFQPVDDITRELAHSILDRKPKKAITYLKKYKLGGDTPLKAIAFIYNGVRSLMAVQLNGGTSNIEQSTGVAYWKVKDVLPYVNRYQDHELVDALKRTQFVDSGIKSGMLDQETALDYLMLSILGGA